LKKNKTKKRGKLEKRKVILKKKRKKGKFEKKKMKKNEKKERNSL